MLLTLKINLTLNMQNIQHIFNIEVKLDVQHLCALDIEVKFSNHRSKYVEKNYHMLNIGGVKR